jgi:tartrate-resistant acid phosphatase type 5
VKTASQLLQDIRTQVWADMEPENLIDIHNEHFQEALAEIAEKVDCERDKNVNIIDFCKTFSKCGMTIVPEPNGVIFRVSTIVKEDFCDPVYYREVPWPLPEFFGKWAMAKMRTIPVFPKTLDLGYHLSDKAQDTPCGRARVGIWAKHRGNIYLAPWIQSVESVMIEWDGVKDKWEDEDPVNSSQAYKRAVRLYWQFLHEDNFGDKKMAATINDVSVPSGRGTYNRALADLMYECERKKKVRETAVDPYTPALVRATISPIIEDLGLPDEPTPPTVLAHIGNFTSGSDRSVAQLVINHAPGAILAAGINASGLEGLAYDQLVGSHFHGFLFPYYGSFGAGAETNKFWPAAADGDWDENGLDYFHGFFATPKNRNYYEVCLGPVHLFVLSMNQSEPDGITETSPQAIWLKSKLALSPAPWKVVLCHKLPDPLWPFKQWGASMVLDGRNYYHRRSIAGMPVITCGCGGGPQSAPPAGGDTAFVADDVNGCGILVASQCTLRYSFLNTSDIVIDGIDLHKLNCVDPGEGDLSTIVGSPSSALSKCQHVFQSNGDPNGVVEGPGLAYCWDIVNSIVWVKDDGITSKYGWH